MTCVYGGLKYTSNETEICLRPTNILVTIQVRGIPGGSVVKASACNAEDPGWIPGLGRSPG